MKILIVTPFFPPQNAVASLRPYSWAKYWGRLDHEVTVYTTLHYGVLSNLNTKLENVKIFEIPIPFIQNFLSSYSKTKKNIKISIKQKIVVLIRNIYRQLTDKNGCILNIRYPDWRDLWARKIIKKARNNFYDMVITTGCPYSVHRVGFALKKKYPNLFWIVDWRDLWTQNPFFKGIKIFHGYEKYLEKKIHSKCNLITTVSDGLADDLRKITTTQVEVVFNGFDSEDQNKILEIPRKKNDKFIIAFTGTFYSGANNPAPLLNALSELNIERKISSNDIEMIFAGTNCDIQEDINKFGLKNYYSYLGTIPREDALKIQYNADAVLFFTYNKMKGLLSGKIYEYLFLSREIWSIGMPEKTEVDNIIIKSNAGIYFGTDVEKIKSHIMDRISGSINGEKIKNTDFISSFEQKKQAEKLLSLYYEYR